MPENLRGGGEVWTPRIAASEGMAIPLFNICSKIPRNWALLPVGCTRPGKERNKQTQKAWSHATDYKLDGWIIEFNVKQSHLVVPNEGDVIYAVLAAVRLL